MKKLRDNLTHLGPTWAAIAALGIDVAGRVVTAGASAALLLACLGMIGPFAIDTYLPAFKGIDALAEAIKSKHIGGAAIDDDCLAGHSRSVEEIDGGGGDILGQRRGHAFILGSPP